MLTMESLGLPAIFLGLLLAASLLLAKPLALLILHQKLFKREAALWSGMAAVFEEMNWRQYAAALLCFNALGALCLMLILLLQQYLPLNPQNLPGMDWQLAFNTSISFVTNTNWQAYSGETSLSYFSQMAGLTVQNFCSAATGMVVAFAIIRALTTKGQTMLGNAWLDLLRVNLYLLLPLALLIALLLVQQGVIQNLAAYLPVTGLEGQQQLLPMGPVASQEAIKMLGTNGGGFFGANSAHPFENPTALSNLLQMLSIFLLPCSLVIAFGLCAGDWRQGASILGCMALVFVAAFLWINHSELQLQQMADIHFPGNMEGKETRFGIGASSLFATVTTAASCGAVNAMHDSFTALGGMMPMWLMQLGEVIFGGVGSGFYGILLFVFLTVFIAGLMIGRSPEYLGKKIETREMKLVCLALLCSPVIVLSGAALGLVLSPESLQETGPHGFSELLYALSSAANNNGSAFGGFNANTPFYNLLLAAAMLFGRFGVILPVLMIAGSMAAKPAQEAGPGTLPTHGWLFASMLLGTLLLFGALTFIPALTLGPVAEQLTFPLPQALPTAQ
ncbi:MAG: potassium-transporting ATPase subunit KdpA [Shewanella algae]